MIMEWFPKKQRSINLMFSPRVEWWSAAEVRKRGSVCPGRGKARVFTAFYIAWEVIRAEWDKSSSFGENMRSRPQFEILSAIFLLYQWHQFFFSFCFAGWLVMFYGISTLLSYLMPNHIHTQTQTQTHTHIYIYIYILRQVLLKTIEYCLLFLVVN